VRKKGYIIKSYFIKVFASVLPVYFSGKHRED
jgi:hypothetical protein